MSTISLPASSIHVNRPRKKFDRHAKPDLAEIPMLWAESLARESLAPESLRGGIARARTHLLELVPQWELPRYLDQLQEATA